MVSKNNKNNLLYTEMKKPHYGLRKLSVGVASVLLSTTLYLGAVQGNVLADSKIGESTSSQDNLPAATQ